MKFLHGLFYFLGGFVVTVLVVLIATSVMRPSSQTPPTAVPEQVRPNQITVTPSTATTSSPVILPESVESTTTGTDVAMIETLPSTTTSDLPTSKDTSTQFVVLAFDGSRAIQMWKDTRAFAKEMAKAGKLIHFTYFINTVYLLAYPNRNFYHPPQHPVGTSPIGFADSEKDVANRLEQMNDALGEGHELGCHLTGHYDGATWTQAEWEQEFKSFFDIIGQVSSLNHLDQEPINRRSLKLPPEGIVGFRAPNLGVNPHLWPVLLAYHFQYDTSLTGKPGIQPVKLKNGLWEFPLEKIPFADSATSSLLSMDYNFYFKQSAAQDVAKKGTPQWDLYYNQVLTSYRNYFNKNYEGNRAPLFIGHHFSLWNDGVYWEALKTFARETCGKPHVRCVSYKEVMDAKAAVSKS